jgi:hypothetical protein
MRKNIESRKNEKIQNATEKILQDALKEVNAETTLGRVMQGHMDRKRFKYLKKDYPQIAAKRKDDVSSITPSTLLQQQPLPPQPTNTQSLLEQELTASRARARQLYEKAIAKHPKKISYDSIVKSGDIQNAAATRAMIINEQKMKARQIVDEIKLKQLEALKKDAIKKDASEKLQAAIRRQKAQGDITKIKKAKEKIGGNVKALLTEKAKSIYSPKFDKTMIINNKTIGQPLRVSKKKTLVSQKKQAAAIEGYENRQVFEQLKEKYKDVMKKDKK